MRFHFSRTLPTEQTKIDPYRRDCEREPGYDWRTDPYYSEANIRARPQASAETQRQKATLESQP